MGKALRGEIDFINRVLRLLLLRSLPPPQGTGDSESFLWSERVDILRQFLNAFGAENELEAALPSKTSPCSALSQGKRFLFLEPILKESKGVPVLDVRWDLKPSDRNRPMTMRFRFFLFSWEGEAQERPKGIGFRFEAPEGSGGEPGEPGSHNFWHAQMITGFDPGDELLKKIIGPDFPSWVPTTQPSIPLASRPMTDGSREEAPRFGDLLVAVLLSIYGGKQLAEINRHLDGDLKGRLEAIGVPF